MRGALVGFWRDRRGTSTVEFALMFPLVLAWFILGAEVGIHQLRQTMFERGVDVVTRDLRLGEPTLQDPEELRKAVCARTLVIANCMGDLTIDMTPVEVDTFAPAAEPIDCRDRTEEIKPVVNYDQGSSNEVMLLRFCVLYDPVFPNMGLGEIMPRAAGGGVPIYATTFYVNEP
ncbi:hypothetical protein SAMN04490244_101592 [Tranquillimonas rosea]|uniref:TadE-like protein n=1 Tax=Tranquillimonas rosea TaxID=641238 RepID=A0A1H9QE04_9RHOB|nr:TadE/TadG family type IV pilus assembly protein [Tranquillimonas rosea]SER58771.1 hypothetical protein SAMN04490244_101592 [Tranquillimonas rosea]